MTTNRISLSLSLRSPSSVSAAETQNRTFGDETEAIALRSVVWCGCDDGGGKQFDSYLRPPFYSLTRPLCIYVAFESAKVA